MMENCIACNGSLDLFASFPKNKIYYCSKCGLGQTIGSKAQVGNYHRDEVYIGAESRFANIFWRRVRLIKCFHPQPGKVLDIGSSTGLMLSLFQWLGWQVQGVEVSKVAAEFAIKRGIPTLTEPVEKIKLPNRSFDVIVMNHTLEHLKNPTQVLGKAKNLLKENGLLLIDVPNFGGLSANLQKGSWPYLLPDEHLWHFTATSLQHLLKKEGFEIIAQSMPSGIWDYASPLKELFTAGVTFKKRFLNEFFTFVPDYLITLLKIGSSLTVVARKK